MLLKENKNSNYHKEFFVDYNDERYIFTAKTAIPYVSSSFLLIKTTNRAMKDDMILDEDLKYIAQDINLFTKEMRPLIPNESYNKEWGIELCTTKLLNS